MGGVRSAGHRFCNKKCLQNAHVLSASQNVPPDVLEKQLEEVWRGACPKCQGSGPVEVHKIYAVWSALVLTRWTNRQQVSCRSCATKSLLGNSLSSLAFGWWGFPWGLIMTPVQITRNVAGMCKKPDATRPSPELRKLVQVHLGSKALAAQQRPQPPSPPVQL
jgi:hypothetical protein